MSMFFRVIDFETSGEQPDGEVIEVGWTDLTQAGSVATTDHLLIRPTGPVSVETTAIHHLREFDLRGGCSRESAFAALSDIPAEAHDLLGDLHFAYVAHSAKFEQSWWPDRPADIPWVCTYKCALRLWPDAPRHSNQVLRYYLGLDLPAELAMSPHRAAPDAYVTAHILKRMLQEAEPAQLIQWSSAPVLLPKVNFGKHFGTPWTEVDYGFLRWVSERDFDEDVLHTVRHGAAGGGMTVASAIVGDSIALAIDLAAGAGGRQGRYRHQGVRRSIRQPARGWTDGDKSRRERWRIRRCRCAPQPAGKDDGTVFWLLPGEFCRIARSCGIGVVGVRRRRKPVTDLLAKVGRGRDVGDIFPRLSCDKCRQKPAKLIGVCKLSPTHESEDFSFLLRKPEAMAA